MKIAIADDHKIIRDGLRSLIESKSKSLKLVFEACDGESFLEQLKKNPVDLAIIDISMEGLGGIETTSIIKKNFPKTKVLILSMHAEKNFVLAALKAKADGYILKECAFEELIDAIKSIMSERIFLSRALNDQIIRDYIEWQSNPKGDKSNNPLTPRETEILKLIAEGLSTKEVAFELDVSPKTVESHRQQIMNKLEISSLAHLIRYALKEGITSL